jgi:hypothetical protein
MRSSRRIFLAILCAVFVLSSCTHYNPALYPSYDVLNPGADVRKNPISVTDDPVSHESLFIVNSSFLMWVSELKAEILKLRKGK